MKKLLGIYSSPFTRRHALKKSFSIFFAVSLSCFATSALAKCDKDEKTIFSCLTAKSKLIEVCDAGKTISYSFGFPNTKPEIVVTVPRDQARKENFTGTGCIFQSVSIPNGKTIYKVFESLDLRQTCDGGGVEVYAGKKQIATVKCKGDVTNNIAETELLEE